MARVRLAVILDEPDRVFLPGDEVRGFVDLSVDEDCTCRTLDVSLGWRTAGEANASAGSRRDLSLGAGEWRLGERRKFPFALVVPPGPPSYDGYNFTLRWTAEAVARLAFAFDGKGEAPFSVAAPPAEGGELVSKEDSGRVERGCALTGLALLAVGALPILLSDRFPGIGYAVVASVGGLIALLMTPTALAYRAVGKGLLEVGPSPADRGAEIACRIVLHPRKDLAPRAVRATLVAEESAPKGSGKGKSTLRHVLATVTTELEGPGSLRAGHEAVYAGVLVVPAGAPPTILEGEHKVAWKVKVVVELPSLPDPSWEIGVVVA